MQKNPIFLLKLTDLAAIFRYNCLICKKLTQCVIAAKLVPSEAEGAGIQTCEFICGYLV